MSAQCFNLYRVVVLFVLHPLPFCICSCFVVFRVRSVSFCVCRFIIFYFVVLLVCLFTKYHHVYSYCHISIVCTLEFVPFVFLMMNLMIRMMMAEMFMMIVIMLIMIMTTMRFEATTNMMIMMIFSTTMATMLAVV